MKLTKIELKAFEQIKNQLPNIYDLSIEKMDSFNDDDIENRINVINKIILLLTQEKDFLNDL